jgi:hypothetical protein
MQVEVSETEPTWAKGGTSYETQVIYTGFGRIDLHRKMFQVMHPAGKDIFLVERPFDGGVVARIYHSETVVFTTYSEKPRMWKEEIAGGPTYYFRVSLPPKQSQV